MLSLYEFLIEKRNYSESDAELTMMLEGTDFPIPPVVVKDIRDYYNYVLEEYRKRESRRAKGGRK